MTKKKRTSGSCLQWSTNNQDSWLRTTTPSSFSKKGQEQTSYWWMQAHNMGFSDTLDSNLRKCNNSISGSGVTSQSLFVFPKCAPQPNEKTPVLVHNIKVQTTMKHPGIASISCVHFVRPNCDWDSVVRVKAPGKELLQFTSQDSRGQPKKRRISSCLNPSMRNVIHELGSVQESQTALSKNWCHVQQ